MTTATWITFSRLLGIPFIIYFLDTPNTSDRWLALSFFVLAASTDWLDGYIARKYDQVSEMGKFLDPLVDKLLVFAPLLSLTEMNLVPAWAVFIILARELAIAGWRVTPSLSGNQEITGANLWGKLKTVSQIVAISLLVAPLPPSWQVIGTTAFWLSLVLTLVSGLIYVLPETVGLETRPSKTTFKNYPDD
jgi:CDP-diacylglycerol---glycerol-3-phosphate 3-phosphatidyltransferase